MRNSSGPSPNEHRHHDHAGLTARLLANGRGPGGKSSYRLLADRLAGAHSVLDLGCGDGPLLALLAGDGVAELAGVDLSPAELALARQRPELADATVIEGRAQHLPFPDGGFDAVCSHMAFMLMDDPERVVAEVRRVLVPGGRFAVVVGGAAASTGAFTVFREQFDQVLPDLPAANQPPRIGDRRTRSQTGMDELLTPAGFAPVDWQDLAIDVSGPVEAMWELVSGVYNVGPLNPAQVDALRTAFTEQVAAIVRPDGTVPAESVVSLASTTLVTDPRAAG